jgi:hypothetical protein
MDTALAQSGEYEAPAQSRQSTTVRCPYLDAPFVTCGSAGTSCGACRRLSKGVHSSGVAPPPAGEFLRKGDSGAGPDWPRVQLRRPARGRPPPQAPSCTSALGSSISEQVAAPKEGAPEADTGEVGSPPLLALWAEAGEWLCSPRRRGSAPTARNVPRFVRQMRTRRPEAGNTELRADSGCYRHPVGERGEAAGCTFPMTAEQPEPVLAELTAPPEPAWRPWPADAVAEGL